MTYRKLPSVDRLLRAAEAGASALPHGEVVAAARVVLAEARTTIGQGGEAPAMDVMARDVVKRAEIAVRPRLRKVINATGVVIQTNLGRVPLSQAAQQAIMTVASGYSNLEYDLQAGARGSRYDHMGEILARLTGAEAGLAVNNNAAAVLLTLACFCAGREVIVSRSQAIEIGGGFRIPDVLRQSGARLVEVGTTNRTYVHDYAAAISDHTAAILTVHRSNFRIVGFTHDPEDAELQALAREHDMLWIDDWGSGSLLQPSDFGLMREPRVQDRIAAGCDLVCFSGDKLLGGPQTGLIVGKGSLVTRLRQHPLLRALRVDKSTIAAMEATLLGYVRGQAVEELPVWQMIAQSIEMLQERAFRLVAALAECDIPVDVVACQSAVGGGSSPGETLPSLALAIGGTGADRLHAALRAGDPAIVGRIAETRLLLDLRTVQPSEDALLPELIEAAHRAPEHITADGV